MRNSYSKALLVTVFLLMTVFSIGAQAQATRTWVSGVGDDANPCSRTAPCKTFAGAISKTAAGGEIDALDDGGFGQVTITKSITINGRGHLAGVLASSGTNGIIINAGASDVVVIRGISFSGVGSGLNAIRYLAGKYVVVEDSTIDGFANGINMVTTVVNGRMDIRNVQMTNATATPNTYGIHIGAAGSISTISNVSVRGFSYGLTTRGGDTYLRGSNLVNNAIAYSNQGGNMYSYGDNMVSSSGSTNAPTGLITHY
jgi:hypothetical protein